jgi:hypothetical protein
MFMHKSKRSRLAASASISSQELTTPMDRALTKVRTNLKSKVQAALRKHEAGQGLLKGQEFVIRREGVDLKASKRHPLGQERGKPSRQVGRRYTKASDSVPHVLDEPRRPVPHLSEGQRRMYTAFGGDAFAADSVAADFIARYGAK